MGEVKLESLQEMTKVTSDLVQRIMNRKDDLQFTPDELDLIILCLGFYTGHLLAEIARIKAKSNGQ